MEQYHEQEPGRQEVHQEGTRQDPEGKKGSKESQEGSNEASVTGTAGEGACGFLNGMRPGTLPRTNSVYLPDFPGRLGAA